MSQTGGHSASSVRTEECGAELTLPQVIHWFKVLSVFISAPEEKYVPLYSVAFKANPCEACVGWLIGVLLLQISWSLLSFPLGPTWIQHMTALADTSFLTPALDPLWLFRKMWTTVQQRHQVVWLSIVPAELRNSCSAVGLPVHPEHMTAPAY